MHPIWHVLTCRVSQIANYWEPSKKLLNDPTKFLDSLLTYDKDNISDGVIKRVEPYIQVSEGWVGTCRVTASVGVEKMM